MGAIDVWAQILTPRMASAPWMESLLRWAGQNQKNLPRDVPSTLASMDEADVELAILSAWHDSAGPLISNEEVGTQIDEAPDRFRGLATVDLKNPMQAVREIRRRVDGKVGIGTAT